MNSSKFLALTLLMALALVGCNEQKPQPVSSVTPVVSNTPDATPRETASPPVPVGDTTQTSVDWAGTYTGVLPCADCEGIEVEVVLNDDNTFKRTATYLGKDAEPVTSDGTFSWKEDGATIVLAEGDEAVQYWVSEGRIVQLDTEGKKIEGDMAEKYVLQKSSAGAFIHRVVN